MYVKEVQASLGSRKQAPEAGSCPRHILRLRLIPFHQTTSVHSTSPYILALEIWALISCTDR